MGLVFVKLFMTTLTIRIDEALKSAAAKQAAALGIPLTLVIKNALVHFVKAPKITIGEVETVFVTPSIQQKMDRIGTLLSKK
jgi:hypothetical protein